MIAQALHTLELLTAEKRSTATASVDAVSREVALPVDDILAAATALLARAGRPRAGDGGEAAANPRRRPLDQAIDPEGRRELRRAAGRARPMGPATARLKGLRVLVVDNDDRIRRSAHALLGRFGCQVETARTGQEALAMARVGTYDAILVDIRLPDLDGYDAYRQLRAAQPQARMVLMTSFGYDAGHSIVKARQDGLRFVLYKPFRTRPTHRRPRRHAGRRAAPQPQARNPANLITDRRKGCPGWAWSSLLLLAAIAWFGHAFLLTVWLNVCFAIAAAAAVSEADAVE